MSFSEQLKTAMATMQISQIELSERTGIGKSSISQYISGKNIPKETTKKKIAKALGCTVEFLDGIADEKGEITIEKITVAQVAKLIKKNRQFVRDGIINGRLNIGSAVFRPSKTGDGGKWSFHISLHLFEQYLGKIAR